MTDPIKSHFPIFKTYPHLAFLDNAATTQRPEEVINSISGFYMNTNANIHRGVYDLSNDASQQYEAVRKKIADFLHAGSIENIGFTSGATESINIVAQSFLKKRLRKGDNVVTTIMEHHANFLPWQKVCEETGTELRVGPINENGDLDLDKLAGLIDEKTRLISVVHISNTLGTINPVEQIIKLAKRQNIPVLIDAAQSAGLYELDVQKLSCDFLVFSGHKIFGPFGAGVLYVADQYRNEIDPYKVGGGMIEHVGLEKTRYRSFPYHLDAGTPNIASIIGMGAAIDFLQKIDRPAAMKHVEELGEYCLQTLKKIEGVRVLGNPAKRAGIVSFTLEGVHPHDAASFLNKDHIAVRAGMHCTQPLLEHMGVPVTLRASFSIYNEKIEIDRLADSIKEIIAFFS